MLLKQPVFGNLYTIVYGREDYVLIVTYGSDKHGDEYSYNYIYDGVNVKDMEKYDEESGYREYLDDYHDDIMEIVDDQISTKTLETLKSLDFMNLEFDERLFIACNQK